MLVATEGAGIYRSTDYSYDWQQTSGIPGDVSVKALAFDPLLSRAVFPERATGIPS